MTIKILIADDHQIIRDGLKALLDKQEGIEVIALASTGREAVNQALEHKPDLVIMDIAMPDLNGIDATKKLLEAMPDLKIIALSMQTEKQFIAQMFQAGAVGYLLKECAFEELTQAIQAVNEGNSFLSPAISGTLIDDYVDNLNLQSKAKENILSNREREVLQLLAEGNSTKETAYTLNVSVKTIETHRRQIMNKLNLHSIAELTKYALKEGITTL